MEAHIYIERLGRRRLQDWVQLEPLSEVLLIFRSTAHTLERR